MTTTPSNNARCARTVLNAGILRRRMLALDKLCLGDPHHDKLQGRQCQDNEE